MNKSSTSIQEFFSKALSDPEIDFADFMDSIAFVVGSTIALKIREEGQGEVLEATFQRMKSGCAVGNKAKMIFPMDGNSHIHIMILK